MSFKLECTNVYWMLWQEKFIFPNHDNVDHMLMALFSTKYRNNRYKTTIDFQGCCKSVEGKSKERYGCYRV